MVFLRHNNECSPIPNHGLRLRNSSQAFRFVDKAGIFQWCGKFTHSDGLLTPAKMRREVGSSCASVKASQLSTWPRSVALQRTPSGTGHAALTKFPPWLAGQFGSPGRTSTAPTTCTICLQSQRGAGSRTPRGLTRCGIGGGTGGRSRRKWALAGRSGEEDGELRKGCKPLQVAYRLSPRRNPEFSTDTTYRHTVAYHSLTS
jgi:hypothetical protein